MSHRLSEISAEPGLRRSPPRAPRWWPGLLLLILGGTGCSIFDPPPEAPLPGDRLSPAQVLNLHLESATRLDERRVRVCLTWTAPGDDGYTGQAMKYQFAYTPDQEEMLSWTVDGEPPSWSNWEVPVLVAGGQPDGHCWELSMPADLKPFFMALRARDNVNNISAVSNIVTIRE